MFKTNEILEKYKLFWQYPVITEEEFFNQNKSNEFYSGVPWATIIDKNYNIQVIYNLLKPYYSIEYYTCCQHIYFKRLIPLFKALNITCVYTPHKCINEDVIDGVTIKPCPLYAVNLENPDKNKQFRDVDLLRVKRKYLFSFVGGYQGHYLSKTRLEIFETMKDIKDSLIINTGDWHFNTLVYNEKQNYKKELAINESHITKTNNYNDVLLNSRYTLCPSGSGPNSIRFWEALGSGSIPILLADTLDLPQNELWKNSILRVKEKKLKEIPDMLENISKEDENKMRDNCLRLYKFYRENYNNGYDNS